jgi:hypothetical protein
MVSALIQIDRMEYSLERKHPSSDHNCKGLGLWMSMKWDLEVNTIWRPGPPVSLSHQCECVDLSHSTSPFMWWVFFKIRPWELFVWVWLPITILLTSVSWVARITGMSYQHWTWGRLLILKGMGCCWILRTFSLCLSSVLVHQGKFREIFGTSRIGCLGNLRLYPRRDFACLKK